MTEQSQDAQHWREEIALRREEFELKKSEFQHARFSSPIVLAIIGASIAGITNAAAIWWNGHLEDRRAEHARVLEILKTGNVEQAERNLKFLVNVGLISDKEVQDKVKQYTSQTPAGSGPALPVSSYNYTAPVVSTYDYTLPTTTKGQAMQLPEYPASGGRQK